MSQATGVAGSGARWVTREELATALPPRRAEGLLLGPSPAQVVPMSAGDLVVARELTVTTLRLAGVDATDRVAVALSSDAGMVGALVAEAAAQAARSAVALGPRGRMRLLRGLQTVGASVLVATPTGAADFLARLHLEFLVDPLDLGLRALLLTGEIAPETTYRHLADEFGADVAVMFTDPVCGIPIGVWRPGDDEAAMRTVDGAVVEPADLAEDRTAGGPFVEVVVRHDWHELLSAYRVRTGYVASHAGTSVGISGHTVGDQLLLRGLWLPLSQVERALSKIDGIATWRLVVDRKGTLDQAEVHVQFLRTSLVGNPMWQGRIEEALASVTAARVGVVVDEEIADAPMPFTVEDRRGQHLGTDRRGARSAG